MIKLGMYVEFADYDENGNLISRIGQWDCAKGMYSIVYYYTWQGDKNLSMHKVQCGTSYIERAEIKRNTKAILRGTTVLITKKSKKIDEKGYYYYYCKLPGQNKDLLISEQFLRVQYDAIYISPSDNLIDGRIGDAALFIDRRNIVDYMSYVDVVPAGFNNVFGKRIDLFEHQLDTVKKVLSKRPYRAILSDEVGLGKTIEALVVLNHAIQTQQCNKALIIVPTQLRYQWYYEAKSKFGLDVDLFRYREFVYKKVSHQIYIIAEDEFMRYYPDANWKSWDFVICDEVHRAVNRKEFYPSLLDVCKNTKNVLLLSATPILQRGEELYRLLKLYEPNYYGNLKYDDFQRYINAREDVISKIKEISFGFKIHEDIDHVQKCIYVFEEIANTYNDKVLRTLINKIDLNDEKKAVDWTNLCFIYLDRRYELSPKYIKHRRIDVLTATRNLYDELPFYYEEENKMEASVYVFLRQEIEEALDNDSIEIEDIMEIGGAFFSSSSAMHKVFEDDNLMTILPQTYKANLKAREIERSSLSNGRLDVLIKYLKENTKSNKIIIFTDYTETAELINKRLCVEFGNEAVNLFIGKSSDAQLQIIANSFKKIEKCKFLVCDKAGSEGKNFQFADDIIHFDTPWSPAQVEQRIGRLHRVGRKANHPVNNIVLYSRDTIEEDLFAMLKNDLNIYGEALCGIEIVYDEMMTLIKNSIKENALLGFDIVSDEIRQLKDKVENELAQEMYEQMSVQLEEDYSDKAKEIIEVLEGEKFNLFKNSVCNWHELCGYGISTKDEGKLISFDTKASDLDLAKENNYIIKDTGSVEGTFSLNYALEEEEVEYLSIQNSFIKNICMNATDNENVRDTALIVHNTNVEWKGFIFFWKLDLNVQDYYDGIWESTQDSIKNAYISKEFLPLVKTYEGEELPFEKIIELINDGYNECKIDQLSIDEVEESLDYPNLRDDFNSLEEEMQITFSELMMLEINYSGLERDTQDARNDFRLSKVFKSNTKLRQEILNEYLALKKAFERVSCVLDSMMYVELVND